MGWAAFSLSFSFHQVSIISGDFFFVKVFPPSFHTLIHHLPALWEPWLKMLQVFCQELFTMKWLLFKVINYFFQALIIGNWLCQYIEGAVRRTKGINHAFDERKAWKLVN